jgi:hypothetical protein
VCYATFADPFGVGSAQFKSSRITTQTRFVHRAMPGRPLDLLTFGATWLSCGWNIAVCSGIIVQTNCAQFGRKKGLRKSSFEKMMESLAVTGVGWFTIMD